MAINGSFPFNVCVVQSSHAFTHACRYSQLSSKGMDVTIPRQLYICRLHDLAAIAESNTLWLSYGLWTKRKSLGQDRMMKNGELHSPLLCVLLHFHWIRWTFVFQPWLRSRDSGKQSLNQMHILLHGFCSEFIRIVEGTLLNQIRRTCSCCCSHTTYVLVNESVQLFIQNIYKHISELRTYGLLQLYEFKHNITIYLSH